MEVDEPEDMDSSDVTIIFCHGYALTHDSWHYQREHLRGSARLVFYDQRSHGLSAKASDASHHIDQLGRDLAAVIDAIAPGGPIVLIGHSMGGMSVMAYADQNPEAFGSRIRGVALVATTAGNVQANSLGLPGPLGKIVQSWGTTHCAISGRARALGRRLVGQRSWAAHHAAVFLRFADVRSRWPIRGSDAGRYLA